ETALGLLAHGREHRVHELDVEGDVEHAGEHPVVDQRGGVDHVGRRLPGGGTGVDDGPGGHAHGHHDDQGHHDLLDDHQSASAGEDAHHARRGQDRRADDGGDAGLQLDG
ncbi:hypothetical protein DTX79_00025, partial [Bacilli bacterium]